MGAHTELNGTYFPGSLIGASLIGWLLQSWVILLVALVVLVAIDLYTGDIPLEDLCRKFNRSERKEGPDPAPSRVESNPKTQTGDEA